MYMWDCRRSQILIPNIHNSKKKIAVKYETEKYVFKVKKQRVSLELSG